MPKLLNRTDLRELARRTLLDREYTEAIPWMSYNRDAIIRDLYAGARQFGAGVRGWPLNIIG